MVELNFNSIWSLFFLWLTKLLTFLHSVATALWRWLLWPGLQYTMSDMFESCSWSMWEITWKLLVLSWLPRLPVPWWLWFETLWPAMQDAVWMFSGWTLPPYKRNVLRHNPREVLYYCKRQHGRPWWPCAPERHKTRPWTINGALLWRHSFIWASGEKENTFLIKWQFRNTETENKSCSAL